MISRRTLLKSSAILGAASCAGIQQAAAQQVPAKVFHADSPMQVGLNAFSFGKMLNASVKEDRIGIVGFSAGGHLAISTATSFDHRAYEPLDDVDKTSCRPDFAVAVYSGYLKAKEKDELVAGLQVPAETPPIFLAHGGDDIISSPEHSVFMYLALKRAGVPAELHVYASTAHDFGVRNTDRPHSAWTESCVKWLNNQRMLEPKKKP